MLEKSLRLIVITTLLLVGGCTEIYVNIYPANCVGDFTLNLTIDDTDDVKPDTQLSATGL